jgi:ubiquitin C-terminal hydrolase
MMNEDSNVEEVLEFTKTGTGLSTFVNVGNTCYLNSALQVLMHVDELHKIFLKTERLMFEKPEYFKDKDTRFYECIKAIYKGFWEDNCCIRPIGLIRYLDQHSYFPMGEQSDSTEVLTCLIQKIHEIICISNQVSESSAKNDLDRLSIKEWNLHLESKDSQLVNMFWGQYYIKNECEECGYTSQKFETFHYFTLPAVVEGEENPNSPTSLKQLIKNFMGKKKFDSDNKYHCDRCKVKVDNANNQSSVWKLPNYLIIQIKRYYENSNKQIRKANRVIKYEESFDPSILLSQEHSGVEDPLKSYKLHSGVFHHGGLHGGHYNCFSWNKDTSEWYGFDDTQNMKFDEAPLEGPSIYQLLYKLE